MTEITPYAGPEHRTFTIGEGDESLLIIHGFPGTPAETRPLANLLAETGFKVHAPLLPGFGPQIASLNEKGRTDWVQAVKTAWMDHGLEGHGSLIGYSMGGALAAVVSKELNPNKLVLVNPFFRAASPLARLVPLLRLAHVKMRPFARADFSDPRLQDQLGGIIPGLDLEDPGVQATIKEQFVLPVNAIDEILKLGKQAMRLAGKISAPTLLVQARDDALALPRYSREFAQRTGSAAARYHEVDGGHHFMENNPDSLQEASNLILEFLRSGS